MDDSAKIASTHNPNTMQNSESAQSSKTDDQNVGRINLIAESLVVFRRRVGIFHFADTWFNRCVRIATAVHEGFWLGCLSVYELNAITAKHYGQSEEFSSSSGNTRGFFDWEHRVVERYFPRGSNVLVAAAGGGREILALRRAGYLAEGFESSPMLVEAGSAMFDQLGEAPGICLCAPDQVPSGASLYACIIIGWGAYTHIPTRKRRVEFLRALGQRALVGSPVLLSFFVRSGNPRYDHLACRIANFIRRILGSRREPVEIGDHLTWSYNHWFTREEIEGELREAGIRLEEFGEDEGYAVGTV